MSAPISIQHMSIQDKLQTMELLWDDLSRRAEANLSPAWHGDELATREKELATGKEHAESWGTAKNRIRNLRA